MSSTSLRAGYSQGWGGTSFPSTQKGCSLVMNILLIPNSWPGNSKAGEAAESSLWQMANPSQCEVPMGVLETPRGGEILLFLWFVSESFHSGEER